MSHLYILLSVYNQRFIKFALCLRAICEAFGKPLIVFPLFSYYQVTRQKENIFGKIFVMFLQVIT